MSYCGEDAPDVHVKFLIEELNERCSGQINFLVYYEQNYGFSLNDFMRKTLKSAHAILLLLGPQYKRRIDQTDFRSGAYQEYDTIVSLLEDRSGNRIPKIIPVQWAGTNFNEAIPEYFQATNLRVCDLHGFRAVGMTQNNPVIPRTTMNTYSDRLDEIKKQLLAHNEIAGGDFELRAADKLDGFLQIGSPARTKPKTIREALEFKFEHGNYNTAEFKSRYFTKTRYFKHLQERNIGLVSGRKGSGKTTLVQIRELEANQIEYFPVIDIAVENWNIHYLIQTNVFKQSEGDFEYVDLDVKLFDYVWAGFTGLCMCHSLMFSAKDNINIIDNIILSKRISEKLRDISKEGIDQNGVNYALIFELAVQSAKEFIQNVVDKASNLSENDFRIDVIKNVTLRAYLFSLFGNDLKKLKTAVFRNGNKRFLFCLDRFDTEIQRYRKEGIERNDKIRQERFAREIDWLSSLTLFVQKATRPDKLSSDRALFEFFSLVKFVIVLPFDRLIELRNSQRDAVASEAIEEIRWQPKELLTMLRKRIQVVNDIDDEEIDKERERSSEKRFDKVISRSYKTYPKNVPVLINGKRFDKELFLNVLRHSFFRPRDILIYFASILSYLEEMEKKNRKPEINAIREVISQETRTIVNLEFIGELRDTIGNIEEIVNAFRWSKQIVDIRDLDELIGPIKFSFYENSIRIETLGEKISLLYDIGFLGFRGRRYNGTSLQRKDFIFSFISSAPHPNFDSESSIKDMEFAIHPIFIDSLFLETNCDVPVLNLDWQMLNAIDRPD